MCYHTPCDTPFFASFFTVKYSIPAPPFVVSIYYTSRYRSLQECYFLYVGGCQISHLFLIHRNTISNNYRASIRIIPLLAGIAAIALNGIDSIILDFFNDTHMVGSAVTLPIEKDNITCFWRVASVLPLP